MSVQDPQTTSETPATQLLTKWAVASRMHLFNADNRNLGKSRAVRTPHVRRSATVLDRTES
jgi:hypothetical protein